MPATADYDHAIKFLVADWPFVIIGVTISIGTISSKSILEQFDLFVKLHGDLNHSFYSGLVVSIKNEMNVIITYPCSNLEFEFS